MLEKCEFKFMKKVPEIETCLVNSGFRKYLTLIISRNNFKIFMSVTDNV